jgi:hypothetical protein
MWIGVVASNRQGVAARGAPYEKRKKKKKHLSIEGVGFKVGVRECIG